MKKTAKTPSFKIEDIEDEYTFYVLIMGISENLFWHAEYSELLSIVADKAAYDNWISYTKQKAMDKAGR